MTEKIKLLLENLRHDEHKKSRVRGKIAEYTDFGENKDGISGFKKMAEIETPLLFDNDSFGFNRSTDFKITCREGNVTPNYKRIIENGFDKVISDIKISIQNTDDEQKKAYGKSMLEALEVCLEICEKYKIYAEKSGNTRLYQALLKIPHNGAESFYEALVFLKICIYTLRLYGNNHLTLGRFDQYMYSYYANDKKAGIEDDEIFELLEEFFIALNYDSDLYHGVQQGDNGQSMVLGGFDENGNTMYNELSEMCMKASLELSLIDPKINLRVGKNTPDEIYEYATLLTKQGLGFPQYCNDDVVVPGLVKLGYDLKDALDYTVAACWEYIIPNKSADIPNIVTMDFPKVINDIICEKLLKSDNFDELMEYVKKGIISECNRLISEEYQRWDIPSEPLLSVYTDGCIETLTDMYAHGSKYMNFGSHGAGIANATDALAAVKETVFDKKTIEKEALLEALKNDFNGYTEIRNLLISAPKMGNNDDYADDIASTLMDVFSKNINNRPNDYGGIWRAGTGSAMEYLWKGEKCPATADGRKACEPYSSSFSPSLNVKTTGLLSVIQSFTKFDMTNIINGGPLTIEIHDSVLRNDVGIKKTAMLVKNFILLGGHQLQLNAINRERLLDAQKHPENYPNLIVRVWGWSGYFNELDVEYQNHIIKRCEYSL